MAWENPKTNWGQLGQTVPGVDDFNRIEGNTEHLQTELTTHEAKSASMTQKGHVQLSTSTTSTSTALAATSSAVKAAMDKAKEAFQSASDGKSAIATAITGKGVDASGSDTFEVLAGKIDSIVTDPSIGTTNAVAADILSGKKAVSQGELLTGTMPNRGGNDIQSSIYNDVSIPSGYYDGNGKALRQVFTAGDNVQLAIPEEIGVKNTSFTKVIEVKVAIPGTYRIKYQLASNGIGSFTVYARIYKNGSSYENITHSQTGDIKQFQQDRAFSAGDRIQLYLRTDTSSPPLPGTVRNFQICTAELPLFERVQV